MVCMDDSAWISSFNAAAALNAGGFRGAPGIVVADADTAYHIAIENGAMGVQEPAVLTDPATGAQQTVAEVQLYGDVILRLVSGAFQVRVRACFSSRRCCTKPCEM